MPQLHYTQTSLEISFICSFQFVFDFNSSGTLYANQSQHANLINARTGMTPFAHEGDEPRAFFLEKSNSPNATAQIPFTSISPQCTRTWPVQKGGIRGTLYLGALNLDSHSEAETLHAHCKAISCEANNGTAVIVLISSKVFFHA